jgi:hypothetical protein
MRSKIKPAGHTPLEECTPANFSMPQKPEPDSHSHMQFTRSHGFELIL